jgi:ATP-dependent Zn protease
MEPTTQSNPTQNNMIFTLLFAVLVMILVALTLFMWGRMQNNTGSNNFATSSTSLSTSSPANGTTIEIDTAVGDIEKTLDELNLEQDFKELDEGEIIE